MKSQGAPVFIIGAGFNFDVVRSGIRPRVECRYPLMADIAKDCFGIADSSSFDSVERLFQDAIDQRHHEPLECFFDDKLMQADYYLAGSIKNQPDNIYNVFLDRYPESHFITFNYDALIEILLLNKRRWRPDDGYGVPVETEYSADARKNLYDYNTRNFVLHLHGVLTIATEEMFIDPGTLNGIDELKLLEEPRYLFDPDSIGNLFPHIRRSMSSVSHEFTWGRCIAPVPDKASQLVRPFVTNVRTVARHVLDAAPFAVSVGYSFNPSDSESYVFVIEELKRQSKPIFVVDPYAKGICERLESTYNIQCIPQSMSFERWAAIEFVCHDLGR